MKIKFKEIANFVAGQSPQSKYYTENEGTPFLQGNRTFGQFYPEIDTYTTKVTKMAKKGDILMSVRAPVGDLNFAPTDLCIGRGLSSITAKDGNNDFLFYALKYNIENLKKQSNGTTYDSVNKDIVENMEMIIPDQDDTKIKVTKLLKNIDNKIENNNKINVQLESMAKTIYDYWFLQFEFPNEEGKPYKSSGGKMVWNEVLKREIPEGWECKKLNEVFDFIKGKTPDKLFDKRDDELIEYLTIEAVNSETIQYCSKESMVTTSGEVLMVMDGAASSDVYVGNIGVIGSTFCKLEIKNNYVDNNFLFLIMKKLEPIFKKVNTGSTVPHANKNYINNFKICLPKDAELRFELQQNIVSCINKIVKNKEQNQELTSLRDFLLPLLMNGQVGFKQVALAE